jgi:cytochrome b involved in lipid metabolism
MKTTKTIFIIVLIAFAIIMSAAVIGNMTKNSGSNTNISNPTNTVTPVSNTTTSTTACIVTIKGAQYDVTALRKTHSGGDVFVCNTDMTNTFFSQHNQRFLDTVMQAFKVK